MEKVANLQGRANGDFFLPISNGLNKKNEHLSRAVQPVSCRINTEPILNYLISPVFRAASACLMADFTFGHA